MRGTIALLIALCLLVALPARGDPDGGATDAGRRRSADGAVSITLPADWTLKDERPSDALVSVRARTPAGLELVVKVQLLTFLNERAQAYQDRAKWAADFGAAATGVVSLAPIPHLVMNVPRPGVFPLNAFLYRVIDRVGFAVTVECDAETWPAVKDACLAAAGSLESALPADPAPAQGYSRSDRDGYEYLVQLGVTEEQVAFLHSQVVAAEKRYASAHGAPPKEERSRPVVVVSADKASSIKVAGVEMKGDFETDPYGACLYAVPLRPFDGQARARFLAELNSLFHVLRYGVPASKWLRLGEYGVVWAESSSPRGLPYVEETHLKQLRAVTIGPFEKLVRNPRGGASDEATVYVLLFKCGAKPWRDAFAAFLKDLGATGDWEAAEKKHLLSLDQDKLCAAAQAWLKELKPVPLK